MASLRSSQMFCLVISTSLIKCLFGRIRRNQNNPIFITLYHIILITHSHSLIFACNYSDSSYKSFMLFPNSSPHPQFTSGSSKANNLFFRAIKLCINFLVCSIFYFFFSSRVFSDSIPSISFQKRIKAQPIAQFAYVFLFYIFDTIFASEDDFFLERSRHFFK